MDKKRSIGVTIFGILLITLPVMLFFIFTYGYMPIYKMEAMMKKDLSPVLKEQLKERGKEKVWDKLAQDHKKLREKVASDKRNYLRVSIPHIIHGFIVLIIGVSILKLRKWGRILVIILSVVNLISAPFGIYQYSYYFASKNISASNFPLPHPSQSKGAV